MNHSVKSDDELIALLERTMQAVAHRSPDMEFTARTASKHRMVSVAAASLLILGVGAAGFALNSRYDASSPMSATTQSTVPPNSTTSDPLSALDLPDGAVPLDAVLRFTSSLGQFGQLWVYDSPTSNEVYLLRRGASGNSFGSLDRGTYETGQAWAYEGNHGTNLLYGLTPPSLPVTVTFGDTTVTSDENGLWYTPAPNDLPGFTLTTADTSTYIHLVTSNETPQTTVASTSTWTT